MPALGFDDRFEAPITVGAKANTIRRPRKDIVVGCQLKLFVRWRRPGCRQFYQTVCSSLRPLRRAKRGEWYLYESWAKSGSEYTVTGPMRLSPADLDQLARRDGFDSVDAFETWFDRYGDDVMLEVIGWHPGQAIAA